MNLAYGWNEIYDGNSMLNKFLLNPIKWDDKDMENEDHEEEEENEEEHDDEEEEETETDDDGGGVDLDGE